LTTLLSKLYDTSLSKSTREEMKLETSGNCFACGKNNPNGLRLSFEVDKEKQTVKTTFVASPVFQGWDGIVHGGILSTLLDEAMATLVYELGLHAITATMEIKFKKPAPILEPLLVYGEVTEVSRRLIRARAHIAKDDGTILAVGISTFMKLRGSGTDSL
jgi:uncharacterized protein (TIGR00369 family)